MPGPVVTIVTPSYNQGRFIRATIESVLAQDYPHLEYIIMDGGSTDETAAVVKEYSGRLVWISEKDRGQSHAINKGFRMAKGETVAWLNSDDTILPGAVSRAVRALQQTPDVGAVYGEGYQINAQGEIKQRFPFTEPFNLWKLVYLWDYILQQTVYFRKSAVEEAGYLDERLHWGLDWDLLIRIAKRYRLGYIPEYLGCLREHDDAKSFSGGARRFRELVKVLRRHGSRRYPPGYVVYGLDTYEKIWCDWIARWTPAFLAGPSARWRARLSRAIRQRIDRTVREAQGWYSDGWATMRVRCMLPRGAGTVRIYGKLPPPLNRQAIRVRYPGGVAGPFFISPGDFDLAISLRGFQGCEEFTIEAAHFFVPQPAASRSDTRKLCYVLKGVEWLS